MFCIIDPLYGSFHLPEFARDICNTPELQRLSEIRLMNVCGATMLGATTTSRLEHALGVAHLANIYSKNNNFSKAKRDNLILGSLIHDVASFPYGHLVEHIFGRLFPGSPNHMQRLLSNIYSDKEDLRIYRGTHCQLYRKLFSNRKIFGRIPILSAGLILGVNEVSQFLNGATIHFDDVLKNDEYEFLHNLISGPIDLDNIDNVFRVAHRFGIVFDKSIPEKLATSFKPNGSVVQMNHSDLWLIEEWIRIRSLIYEIFFTHSDILAMKALLTYCVEKSIEMGEIKENDWVLTDTQLLEKLCIIDEIKHESKQILLGHELECISLLEIEGKSLINIINQIEDIRKELSLVVDLVDRNKNKIERIATHETLNQKRYLFLTAEYDKGATSRDFEVEIIGMDDPTAMKKLSRRSDRVYLSAQIPRWCAVDNLPYFVEKISKIINRSIGVSSIKRIDTHQKKHDFQKACKKQMTLFDM